MELVPTTSVEVLEAHHPDVQPIPEMTRSYFMLQREVAATLLPALERVADGLIEAFRESGLLDRADTNA
jgi:hypothetical protein